MSALVRKFSEENPDIGVESLQGLPDFVPKMQAAAISGTAPDVALLRHYYIGAFASKDVLSPLKPDELDAAGITAADYDPTVWGFTTYEDQQYTIPLDIHCFAQLYNKTLLDERRARGADHARRAEGGCSGDDQSRQTRLSATRTGS